MRLIRFLDNDGRRHLGRDHGDGTATEVLDPQGVLGPASARHRRALFHGKRAVVADDDENMRELMRSVLERVGCKTIVCADGRAALDAIEHEPVDLVVSDIVMPEHNGYEIYSAARIRSATLPVVLVTGFGYDPSHSLVQASTDGHEAVLFKPFSPQDLLDEVEKAIRETTPSPLHALIETTSRLEIHTILPPVTPADVICIGRSYRSPAAADGRESQEDDGELEVFLKPTSSIVADGIPIQMPKFDGVDPGLDAEGELAVVIGATAHGLTEATALDVVIGYTIANDITARFWQHGSGGPRWMRGKGFDGFCPLGPHLLTSDEAPDPGAFSVRTFVNDTLVRDGSPRNMLRSVAAIIATISQHMTLAPGTVILTGAPPALGSPTKLELGDRVTVEIEPIGRLTNVISA